MKAQVIEMVVVLNLMIIKVHRICTLPIERISPWMYLGGVQLIPTPMTCSHEWAIKAHSAMGSPLTTLVPSLELKENQAGMLMASSSRSSAYAYITLEY